MLVTTLTKKMAEDLTDYFQDVGVKVRYIHSDVETIERVEIIRDLRAGSSTSWSASTCCARGSTSPRSRWSPILDADKEGFLRSARSLIQTIGRAARNVNGTVIMYADTVTDSMQRALDETARRRTCRGSYNESTASRRRPIRKAISGSLVAICEADYVDGRRAVAEADEEFARPTRSRRAIARLRKEMRAPRPPSSSSVPPSCAIASTLERHQ